MRSGDMAQLVEYLPSMHWVLFPVLNKLGGYSEYRSRRIRRNSKLSLAT